MTSVRAEVVRVTVAILGAADDASEPFFDEDWSGQSLRRDFEGDVGLGFVARSTFVITAVGRYVENVLQEPATLKIWDAESEQALCSVSVGPDSPKEGCYAYEQIFPRIIASAGREYRLTQRCRLGMPDPWPDAAVRIQELESRATAQYARFLGGFYNFSGGYPSFVDQPIGQRAGMVNFKISPGIAVLTLNPGSSVYELKHQLENVTGVPPLQQRLLLGESVLVDRESLTKSGIVDGSLVMLAVQPGSVILSTSTDGLPRLWNVEEGKCVRMFAGHHGAVHAAAFSPSGASVVTVGDDCTARIWSVEDDECVRILIGHAGPVVSVNFSPTGAWVLTASRDCTARLWEADSGCCLHMFTGHTGALTCAVFSPDGASIATASLDGTLGFWRSETGEVVHLFESHRGSVLSAAFSLDNVFVLTTAVDSQAPAKIWDFEVAECLFVLSPELQVYSAAFAPDGSSVVAACVDRAARIWCVGNAEQRAAAFAGDVKQVWHHDVQVRFASFSSDGSQVVTTCEDFTLRLWMVDHSTCMKVLSGHTAGISAAIFSPDGSFVVSGSDDCTAKVWSVVTGDCLNTLHGHSARLLHVTVSP